jgi:hypothetical protein
MAHEYEVNFRFPCPDHGQHSFAITGTDPAAWGAGYMLDRQPDDRRGAETITYLRDGNAYPRAIVAAHLRYWISNLHPIVFGPAPAKSDPIEGDKETNHGEV